MNFTLIDINNILNDFSNVAAAKSFIESKWIKTKKIKESLSLQEFILSLRLQDNIYVFDENTAVPFSIEIVDDNAYLFYCINDDKKWAMKTIANKLESIYLSKTLKTTKVNIADIALDGKYNPDFPYLLINRDMYSIENI